MYGASSVTTSMIGQRFHGRLWLGRCVDPPASGRNESLHSAASLIASSVSPHGRTRPNSSACRAIEASAPLERPRSCASAWIR